MRALSSMIALACLAGCATQSPSQQVGVAQAGTVAVTQTPLPLSAAPSAAAPTAQASAPRFTANGLSDNSVTGPVNGIYIGTMSLITDGNDTCPTDARGLIEVGDRTMLFSYLPTQIFVVRIPVDGKLHADLGAYTFDGRLADGDITAVVTGPGCRSEMALTRRSYF